MKTLLKLTSVLLFSSTIFTSYSYADEDQATYAVVNAQGVVTNVIVCGPAVCGPNGSWGGVAPDGGKLVLQVPVNPVTGQNQGSYIGTPENPVKYDAQAQVFTQGSASVPAPVTREEVVETTTISVTINSEVVTFGPESFVDGQMQLTPVVTEDTGASISATEGNVTQTQSFDSPQTRVQVTEAVQNQSLLQRRLERLFILLRGWILE